MKKFFVFMAVLISSMSGVLIGWITYNPLQIDLIVFAKGSDVDYIDIEEQGILIDDIVTSLKDRYYTNISFQLVGSDKKVVSEIEKREFQIRSYVIQELSKMTKSEFQKDLNVFENNIKNHVNDLLEHGEILDVYLVEKIVY